MSIVRTDNINYVFEKTRNYFISRIRGLKAEFGKYVLLFLTSAVQQTLRKISNYWTEKYLNIAQILLSYVQTKSPSPFFFPIKNSIMTHMTISLLH